MNYINSRYHVFLLNWVSFITQLSFLLILFTIINAEYIIAKTNYFDLNNDLNDILLKADRTEFNNNEDFIYADGNLSIKSKEYIITAKSMLYDIKNDLLWIEGDVLVHNISNNQIIYGTTVFFKNKLKQGIIKNFALKFKNNSLVFAKLTEKINNNQAILYDACVTPCDLQTNRPIWKIRANKVRISYDEEKIVYNNVFFELYNVPIFYTPYFSQPISNAKARSGILVPELYRDSLRVPMYIRYKPNIDFTITPRVHKKYQLLEIEARHKLKNGTYEVEASYGKVPYNTSSKDTNLNSYYIFSFGNFNDNNINYGFNIKSTSDKFYLKNYYGIYDNYLNSKLYIHKINNSDYLSIEGIYFQNFTNDNKKDNKDFLILPKIKLKKVYDLEDYGNSNIIFLQNADIIEQNNKQQLLRSSSDISFNNKTTLNSGQILDFKVKARGDLYYINNVDNNITNQKKKNTIGRYIPEAQVILHYPFIKNTQNYDIVIEPVISSAVGMKFQSKSYQYIYVDSNNYELSEYNIFNINKYNGLDYYEAGRRMSYGMKFNIYNYNNDNYSLFIAQSKNCHNVPTVYKDEYIGYLTFDINFWNILYRFRKDKSFNAIMDEFFINFNYNNIISTNIGYISLNNINKYYTLTKNNTNSTTISSMYKNKINQLKYSIDYNFSESWKLSTSVYYDIYSNKMNLLYRDIRLTYFLDCIKLRIRLYDDYTVDKNRGITKNHSKGISLGLKTLNL